MAVIEKDLGPVSAYAVAVAHGYTGTEAEWEALIANSAINAQSAGASATAAAASAQEATQQKTQAQAQAAAAQAHALDASRYAQNAGQANSYAQMASSNAAVSAANASNAQTAAEAAQAAAEAAVTGAEAAQTAAEAAVTDAQTAKTAAETAAATAAAAYGTDLLADDYSTSKTYAVGDYVIYSGNLYRCTTAITTAEAWTAAHWTRAQVGPDLDDLKSAFIDYENVIDAKNVLKISDGSSTPSGVTVTKTSGVVVLDGTSTASIYYKLGEAFLYADREYIFTGKTGASGYLQLCDYGATTIIVSINSGNSSLVTVDTTGLYMVRFRCASGVTYDNEYMYPMIRPSYYLDDSFEPYPTKNNGIAVWIGDSFVQANSLASAGLDQTKRFSTLVSEHFGLTEKNYAVGGMGFITGDTPYPTQVNNAYIDRTYDHNKVTHVFVSGGINDLNTTNLETLLYPAVANVVNILTTVFPYAQIYVIPMTYYDKNISQIGYWAYKTIASICADANATLIGNAYTWLNGMRDDILSDGVHPNIAGHALIASHIINAMTTGNSYPFPASCAFDAVSSKLDTSTTYYFTTIKNNGVITANGYFNLTSAATANERLYQYENTDSKNNDVYVGRYGKHVPCFNISTGESGVLLLSQEETTNGYINYVNAVTALSAGQWKVMSCDLNIGVQEYSGNRN